MAGWLPDWNTMFVPAVPLLEIFLRGTIMYLGLILLFRVVLNRQGGHVGLPDILLVVLVADASQNGMTRDYQSVTEGILLVGTLLFWDFALDWLTYHCPPLKRLLHSRPLLLIRNGRPIRNQLREELISDEDLISELRQQGIDSPEKVREARMEANGRISVIKAEEPKHATKRGKSGKSRRASSRKDG